MARRKEAHGGVHVLFVTFADLMALLVSFFVMLVAFSNQDQQKLQIVAGSMRDAFGVQNNVRYSGIIEVDGLPTRPRLKNAAHIQPEDASATPTPDEKDHNRQFGAHFKNDQAFSLAAASLRQALQDMPELTEASKHIMVEETKEWLNIDIVDQEGHTAASHKAPTPDYGPWNLSADRANAVRQILEEDGLPIANLYAVAGNAIPIVCFRTTPISRPIGASPSL